MVKKERTGFFKWYLTSLVDNYANFSGRARRQEFWVFFLFQIGIFFLLIFLSAFLEDYIGFDYHTIPFLLYLLATLIPWLAVNIRRLHDSGKSGGYIFVNLIPLIGRIWYIVLMATAGNIGSNQYGPDPKKPLIIDEIDDIGKPLLDQ